MASKIKEPVITLSAGPVAAYPRVLRAMSRPVQYDFDPWFQQFYEDVTRKCAAALRVKDPALILQVEPAPGIEAAAASLISPNDTVLNLASGVYGKGFGYWSARYHKDMVEIEVPYNEAIDPGQVADAFRKRPDIKIVSLVHHDTPSGTLNPAREIGKIVREHDGLLIVDAVSSFGGMDIHPDDCFADIFITGPGKCLGAAPGLTIMSVSDRAWKHIEANPKAPFASVLSLKDWKNAWSKEKPFPFTPSVAEINGLDGLRNDLGTTRRDTFVRQFCRKLPGYALGRSVQLSDEPLLDEMQQRLEQSDYRSSAAVETIVASDQFRKIRGKDDPRVTAAE